jgi:hypothetical protein
MTLVDGLPPQRSKQMTTEDTIKTAILAAVDLPTDENVAHAIKAMRTNPLASAATMRALPKDAANRFAELLDAFWRRGRKL